MSKFEECTTWSCRKRHLSDNLAPAALADGLRGFTLCTMSRASTDLAYDEDAINSSLGPYRVGKPRIVLADLPACKRCETAAKKGRS